MAKNKELHKEIKRAEKGDGYFIMVSRREGDTLFHTSFTKEFKTDDLIPSIEKHREKAREELKNDNPISN